VKCVSRCKNRILFKVLSSRGTCERVISSHALDICCTAAGTCCWTQTAPAIQAARRERPAVHHVTMGAACVSYSVNTISTIVHFDVVCSREVGQARSRPADVLLAGTCRRRVLLIKLAECLFFRWHRWPRRAARPGRPGIDEYYEKVRVKRGEILTDWFVGGQRGASATRARQARRQYGRGEQA
jgi:hypothetical protein